MTITERPVGDLADDAPEPLAEAAAILEELDTSTYEAEEGAEAAEEEEEQAPVGRPLGVAFLSSAAAALMTGGIFGSWPARFIAVAGAAFGVGWTFMILRRKSGRLIAQMMLPPVAGLIAILLVVPDSGGENPVALMDKAVEAGRVLRPPVPFDPGWRPLLFLVFVVVGFAAAWVGTALSRPQLALVLPLPLLALTAISQPAEGEVIAAFLGLVPLVVAVTLLFGGDTKSAAQLGREFEVKRLLRSVAFGVPIIIVLALLAQSDFLFPKPAYNPAQKPQKPKAIPLNAADLDKILFEVAGADGGDPPISGPWRLGALDVYDGTDWRLPPFEPKRLRPVPADGLMNPTGAQDLTVRITVRDLGDNATIPTVAGPVKVDFPDHGNLLFDPQTQVFRQRSGRIPNGFTYTQSFARYPAAKQLEATDPNVPREIRQFMEIPDPPPAVREILQSAPPVPWQRFLALRAKLNAVVIASGAGVPGPVPPSKVQDLLAGSHKGTPFQIVAAEAMLARWAGLPSRIGFGFDAPVKEGDVWVIHPTQSAQFLEAWFNGYGWVPLVSAPPKAETALNASKNQLFNPTIQPSDEVAVQLFIPIELESLKQLYEQIRWLLMQIAPVAAFLLAIYLALPAWKKSRRRAKRRDWAQRLGPRAQVAVEYAEWRDMATDLSIGDPYDTPLEYLERVVDDPEHQEFAWLVARSLYGDMRETVSAEDALAAREMSESLRKRAYRAQPLQSRVLATLSRASLALPYTDEVPNVNLLKLRRRRPSGPAPKQGTNKRRAATRRPRRIPALRRTRKAAMAGGAK